MKAFFAKNRIDYILKIKLKFQILLLENVSQTIIIFIFFSRMAFINEICILNNDNSSIYLYMYINKFNSTKNFMNFIIIKISK